VIAQFVSSEALATILAIAVIAIAVHLASKKSSRATVDRSWTLPLRQPDDAAQCAGLFCDRPIGFLFGTIVFFPDRRKRRLHFGKFLITSAVGALALIAGQLTVLSLCLVFHEPYRFVIGRSLIYRFDLIDRMPTEEKAVYLRKLQTSASDPITKEAISAVLEPRILGDSMRVIKI